MKNEEYIVMHCPFCGGLNIHTDLEVWPAYQQADESNVAELWEHQCENCGGRSFWT